MEQALTLPSFTAEPYYEGVIRAKSLPDRREVHLRVMLFNLRLSVTDGPQGLYYEDEYCYHDSLLAELAFRYWDGNEEPIGWAKHPATDRIGPGYNLKVR